MTWFGIHEILQDMKMRLKSSVCRSQYSFPNRTVNIWSRVDKEIVEKKCRKKNMNSRLKKKDMKKGLHTDTQTHTHTWVSLEGRVHCVQGQLGSSLPLPW